MKKLTSAVVASSLVLGLVGTALAAPTADEQQASFNRMAAYDLARGTDRGPELEGPLTRAQLVTIIARAFGQETTANLLMDVGSFSDVPGGKWYSGYVAVAKNLATQQGFALGYPDGTFQPDKPVTVIEALAMIMKFLGVPVGTGDNWVNQTIENAKAAGVITDADVEKYFAEPNATATRGVAFALADQIFSTYKFPGTDKTVYTRYVDTVAPALTVTKPANPTTTAATFTVQGVAEAGAEVYVKGDKVTVGANGAFSHEVALEPGENSIEVVAKDLAGNVTTDVITITRVAGEAAKIVAEPLEVQAGSEVELSFKVVDENGLELADAAAEVEVTLSEGIGTYEDGIFKASEKAGKGTITLTYGDLSETIEVTIVPGPLAGIKLEGGVESVAPGEAIQLIAVDEFGNEIEGATFSADHANVFIKDNKFFTATKPGEYTVTATVGDVTKEGTILVYGELDDLSIEAKTEIVANGKTEYEIVVKAVDENGAVVGDFNEDIVLVSEDADLEITSNAAVKAVNGVATFKVKAHAAGTYELEASAHDRDIVAYGKIKAVEQEATALKVEADEYLAIGWSGFDTQFTVKIVDQVGEPMIDSGEGYDVTVRVSGPAYLRDTESQDDGKSIITWIETSHDFYLIPTDEEGTVTITATAKGLKEGSAKVAAVYAGAPRRLVIKKDTTDTMSNGSIYRIGVTDSKGVPVVFNDRKTNTIKLTFNTADVKVWYSDAKDGVYLPAEPDANSSKVYYVEFEPGDPYVYVKVADDPDTAGKPSSVSMTASVSGLTSASATIEFKATPASGFKITNATKIPGTQNDYRITLKRDTSVEVELQLVDQDGKAVARGVRVELESNSDVKVNGKTEYTTYTDSNGRVKVRITLPYYEDGGIVTIKADGNRDGVVGDVEASLQVIAAESPARSISITRSSEDPNKFKVEAYASGNKPTNAWLMYTLTKDGDYVDLEPGTPGKQVEGEVDPDDMTIDLTDLIADTGNYTLTVYAIDSVYAPKKSFDFKVLGAPAKIAFSGQTGDRRTQLDVRARTNDTVTVKVDLLDSSGKPAQVPTGGWKVWVSLEGGHAGRGQVWDGTQWVTPGDSPNGGVDIQSSTGTVTIKVRGNTSYYGNVRFVLTPEWGSGLENEEAIVLELVAP